MKSFTLKKIFSVALFLSISLCSFATPDDSCLDVDQKIVKLNDRLSIRVAQLTNVFENLPDLPRHFFIDGKCVGGHYTKFYAEAPKVLNMIDFLVENKGEPDSIACLNDIIEIFYYQSHKFIDGLPFEALVEPSLSKEQKALAQFDLKKRLLSVLHDVYCGENMAVCDCSGVPLALHVTKGMVTVFGTKSNTDLGLERQVRSLHMQFLMFKSELSNFLLDIETRSPLGTAGTLPTNEKMSWFIDNFQKGVIISKQQSTWKGWFSRVFGQSSVVLGPIIKYALIVALVTGGIWGAIKCATIIRDGMKDFGKNAGQDTAERLFGKGQLIDDNGQLNPQVIEGMKDVISVAGKNVGIDAVNELKPMINEIRADLKTAGEEFKKGAQEVNKQWTEQIIPGLTDARAALTDLRVDMRKMGDMGVELKERLEKGQKLIDIHMGGLAWNRYTQVAANGRYVKEE